MATIVICGPDSFFGDDVYTTCATCAAPIVHRPHVPPDSTKICVRCALKRCGPATTIGITQETMREVLLWKAPTKGQPQ